MLTYTVEDSNVELSSDKHGNFNLLACEDIDLYPHRMPVDFNTKVKVKEVKGCAMQAFGTELLARKYLVTIPNGVWFLEFEKEIVIPLMNYGDNLVKIKKGMPIAQFRIVPVC